MCERETGPHHTTSAILIAACVCVRERKRERVTSQQSVQPVRNSLNRGLFAHIYEHHHGVFHPTLFPSRAWTDGKTKDIINCLYIYFESWSSRLWKGALYFRLVLVVFGQSQCTVPVGQSEQTALVGMRYFVKTKRLREAGHRGPTIMYSIWKICFFYIKTCQHILLHQIHKIMIFKKASNDPFKAFALQN